MMLAAVVLAAGAATRFGVAEAATAPSRGARARARRAARRASSSWLGAHDARAGSAPSRCPDWERGPGASLRCGLAALGADVEAAIVVLADGPELAPAAIERVAAAWRDDRRAARRRRATAASRGHPLLLARAAWGDIPDEGLRAREPLLVPCDDLGAPGDVD